MINDISIISSASLNNQFVMGVHGLWKLLEAAGKPVPLESLENKVLAVDVSIWLHQMMKGYQDSRGAPVANAHLLGLFHRVCKLMFYKIKPVFVFDGGVPLLKKQTIAARRKQKAQASQNASEAKERLLKNLAKRKAVRQMLHGSEVPAETQTEIAPREDMFELPPLPENALDSGSEDETQEKLKAFMESSELASDSDSEPDVKPSSSQLAHGFKVDLHTLDVHSEEFLSLPPDVRHDILSDLKETRKQNSWGRIHEMPEESGEFSNYQLGRLLKRRNVQVSLEQAEKEMGGKVMRINELQELMAAQGVEIIEDNTVIGSSSHRIASDSKTRFILCKDPTGPAQSTQQSDSSKTALKEVEETEDNPLYSEQVEFIAQMAENMMQKIVQTKQEKNISHELVLKKDKAFTESKEELEGLPDKILLDSWSDDDDDVSSIGLSTVKNQKRKSGSISSDVESKHNSSDTSPPRKILILNESGISDNEDLGENLTETRTLRGNESQNKSDSSTAVTGQSLLSEDKINRKERQGEEKKLEIIVCPGEKPEDDIFADIFQSKPLENKVEKQNSSKIKPVVKLEQSFDINSKQVKNHKSDSKEFVSSISVSKKPLEIVIQATSAPEDDIFADIFNNYQTEVPTSVKIEVDSNSEPESVEKILSSESEGEQENIGPDLKSHSDARMEVMIKEEDNDIEQTDHQNVAIGNNDLGSLSSEGELDSAESISVVPPLSPKQPMSSLDLNTMEASLEAENIDLQRERGRQERLAASITDQMCIEAQELLQLFGLPYLVAPMEAEAQCAFLDAISLTEGSITDDSDIWLFGGRKVYKNFFNQKKHVLQFTSTNINHYFKLSREQLIQLALLVGSDYTTGIQGVGPVTAMEIVAAFQCKIESDPIQSALKGLSQFKEWWSSGRPHKSNNMRLLDKKLKNVKFSEGFPSQAVVEAYLRPSVENSEETFSWGALDLPALRLYAKSKFGWTVQKTDEILLPVSKRWSSRASQRSIDSYFNFQPHLVEGLSKMSKRVQKAVNLMGYEEDSDSVDDPDPKPTTSTATTKRKPSSKKPRASNNTNSKRTKAKSKRAPVTSDNDESDVEIPDCRGHEAKSNSDTCDELPVRAPLVPRERTSTGVKRVGLKSSNTLKISSTQGESKSTTQFENLSERKQTSGRQLSKQPASKVSSDIESDDEQSTTSTARQNTKSLQSKKTQTRKKSDQTKRKQFKNIEEEDVSTETAPVASTKKITDAMPSGSGSFHDLPGCSGSGSSTGFSDRPSVSAEGASLSSELAALTDMNWEEDPWGTESVSEAVPEPQRPKVFFGGIRPNKPRKPARPRIPNPVEAADARGVQPGWVTRERLESRTAFVDDLVRRKRDDSIPQRERDQKAMEEAKMKAISVVKAAEARNATRLLGRQPSKRGKGRVKVTRKILPEHNLSESSSDD